MTVVRHAQMRYVGQLWEVLTPIRDGELSAAGAQGIADAFHAAHDAEHGVKSPTFPVELVSIGLTASGEFMRPASSAAPDSAAKAGETSTRSVYFSGVWHEIDIHAGEELQVGVTITGPAIIDYQHSETVLPPATFATIGADRNLIITLDEID
jgi:N-methylhydantoinase A